MFSFDDDVIIHNTDFFWKTLELFEQSQVAAVALPFFVTHRPERIHQSAPDARSLYLLHAFVGAAHAVRKSQFFAIGGYRDHYFYMGEEGDLCLRLLDRGYLTVACNASPVEHCESPIRVSARADYYGRRNDILTLCFNAPARRLFFRLPGTVLLGIRHMAKTRRFRHHLRGMIGGLAYAAGHWAERRAVSLLAFDLHYFLKQRPCTPEAQISVLPPFVSTSGRRNG